MFYNAAMAPDRDLNVAFGAAAGRLGRGWEMMAATGVRGLRLAHETAALDSLFLTERGRVAISVLRRNARGGSGPPRAVMRHDAGRPLALQAFDYVDLDPYGSPAPYLGAALDAVRTPGTLAVTATDMRVLAGVERGVAERRYGAVPLRGRLASESGLRILLAFVHGLASARGYVLRPLLAYVRDHHVRAYLRLERASPGDSGPESAPVARIDPTRWTGPRLPAGGPYGPMWVGPLFDPATIGALAGSATADDPASLVRLISRLKGELVADQPFFYESNVLAHEEHLDRPTAPDGLIETLRAHGWSAARTHAREGAFRTTAPRAEVVRLLTG